MLTPFFGEFMGTMVIVLLGDGTNAAVLLKGSKAENSGWIVIATGWAFAVFCGIVTAIACGSPGAHLNPAVTIAIAIKTGDFSHVLSFIAAQMLGGIAGAVLVYLAYQPHWAITEGPAIKLGVFCTAPAIRKPFWNVTTETIGTALLLLVIGAVGAKTFAPAGPAPGLAPYLVAMIVWAIGLGLGGPTGYAINPARDLGPRITHALLPIAGKGGSDWGYSWVPVVGPILGAIIAGMFFRYSGI